ncbi:MAG: SDR family oxidoreductase, partial [Proteobacteria bacterium]|nr:SDR family oxidoreductase [Pseudomonadota bacterium]
DGWKVWAAARDDAALSELRAAGAEALKLDVASAESIAALGWQLDGIKLDLAVYVAGVFGAKHGALEAPTAQAFDQVMHTNVLGAMQVIPTVAPLVESSKGRFVFISSGMGSIAETASSGGWVYRTSKAALNMVVKTAAADYPQAMFLALCPGWVQTDMGGPGANITPQQSVAGMRTVIAALQPADSGTYRGHDGRVIPW